MRMRRYLALTGSVLAVLVLAGGCAGTPPAAPLPPAKALQAGDFAILAGEWQGTLEGVGGTGPLAGRRAQLSRVVVAPDGSFTSNVNGQLGVGNSRIEDGKVVFEGSFTRGVATYHEGDGRKVLRGEGTWVGVNGRSAFELTKR